MPPIRQHPPSLGLTAGQPKGDGSRGLISGALFKAARQSTGLTQQGLADALAVDKTTVQAWETARRPLTSARAGRLVSLRYGLLDLGAEPALVDGLDTAAQADHLLDRLLDTSPSDARHPLAVRVLPQRLSELLTWPLKGSPPQLVASAARAARRGPAADGPVLTAADRTRLVANLRRTADVAARRGESASLVRRQATYLASFDRSAETAAWLAAMRRSVRWSSLDGSFSPAWAEARSVAVALDRQGDPGTLAHFVAAGRESDAWERANLNYWAYWVGETRMIQRDDAFMGARLGTWRGLGLLGHLADRIGPDSDDLALNVHTVWSLLVARQGLLDDDPSISHSLAGHVAVLLDRTDIPAEVRRDAESIRSALALTGIAATTDHHGSTNR